MPHHLELILTLTGCFTAALLLGFVTLRLGLSPIVGYLLAGVAVGPFTPGFVAHAALAEQLAEIGVILLMFGVGLQLHLHELLAVRRVVLPGAALQLVIASTLGTLLGRAFGLSPSGGLVFGISIAVTSTVVLLRVLSDTGQLHTRVGHIAVGWLVVEDLFTVIIVVTLPAWLASRDSPSGAGVVFGVGAALLKIGVLVLVAATLGRRAIPKLLSVVASTRSRELFTLTVLVVALGLAVGSALLFGASFALGAFLAGVIVGQSEFSSRAASEALPMRDAFSVLFFVSVGMLLDPAQLARHPGMALSTLALVAVGRPLIATLAARVLGQPLRTALPVGAALGQIGEFSFIVISLGRKLGVLPDAAAQVLVFVSIASITLSPLCFRAAQSLARASSPGGLGSQATPPSAAEDASGPRALVVGFGPVGRVVTRLLEDNGIVVTVIDLNHETIRALRERRVQALYGDATQRAILEQAGIASAESLFATASGPGSAAVIRAARALNPSLRILARANYAQEVADCRRAGADVVVSGEQEVALCMIEHLLEGLGASPDQLDRERARVRSELEQLA